MKRIGAATIPAIAAGILLAASGTPAADGPRLPGTAPGWKIETVAEAPVIAHPSVVCSIPDGRLLVAEDPMSISAPADKPSDRILCLHPDGRITVFAEKLYCVFGMRYLEGKVYVLHNPYFSVFTDDGGVGRDREDLIECTNPNPWALDWSDHIPANFRLGMDGYFYIAVGDKGVYGAVGRDGKRIDMKLGGILRMRPDATGLEIYVTGTRNHPDVAMNAEDELFTYDNTDEKNAWWTRVTHMVDGGYYGFPWDYRPRRPYTLWMMTDYGGGAPAGALAYEEDALPAEYRGNLFLVEWARRELLRLRVERDGATYRIASSENFLPGAPGDFKPVGIDVSADGMSFYIADWNHPDSKANVRVGRLHKLTYTGKSAAAPRPAWYVPASMGRPFEASTEDLLAALSHPARSVRITAQRRIAERGSAAIGPLSRLLSDSAASPRARWHAIWALDAIDAGASARDRILAALRDPEPTVRLQAARQLGTRRVKEAVPALTEALRAPDAALRFRAATALGRVADPRAIPALRDALDEQDLFARYAAFHALNRIGRADPDRWKTIAAGLSSPGAAVREGTLFALRDTPDARAIEALAHACRQVEVPGDTRAAALGEIAAMHRLEPAWKGEWWAYFPLSSGRPKKTVEWEGTAIARAALLHGLEDSAPEARRAAALGLVEAGDPVLGDALAAAHATEKDPGVRAALLGALSSLGRPEAARAAEEIARDENAPAALALAAVLDAGRRKDLETLAALASPGRDPQVLVAALEALASPHAGRFVSRVADLLRHGDPSVRAAAVEALASIGEKDAASAATALLEDPRMELRGSAIRALGKLRSRESIPVLKAAFLVEATRFEAATALARMPDPSALDVYLYGLESRSVELRKASGEAVRALRKELRETIESRVTDGSIGPRAIAELQRIYAEPEPGSKGPPPERSGPIFDAKAESPSPEEYLEHAVASAGDPARGRRLFEDRSGVACVRCHGSGASTRESLLGPDLTGIGAQYDRKQLAEHVLWPSRSVREGYRQSIAILKDGSVVTGLARGEIGGEVIILDADGKEHRLPESEIGTRENTDLSIMPEGLQTSLSLDDFADIIAFLESSKSTRRE